MKQGLIFFFLTLLIFPAALAQQSGVINGEVTYLTSRNVYVRFDNTRRIQEGDTLFLTEANKPCLLVVSKSSTSCVCTRLDDCVVEKGTSVNFNWKEEQAVSVPVPEPIVVAPVDTAVIPEVVEEEPGRQKINGRISLSQYSNIGEQRDDRHRLMTRVSFNADNIANSNFSVETYLNYRRIFPTDETKFSPNTSMLRVFSLAGRYETDRFMVAVGRRINSRMSSVGAIDGLQAEVNLGPAFIGAIAGSRPDHIDFRPNPQLFQAGGYVGVASSSKAFRSQTTLGMIQQQNAGNIDRRYAYFQHSGTIARKLTLFSSAELDLYSLINGVPQTNLRLTNLFVSSVFRVNRAINLMVSYDTRRRIVFYETFQTDVERLLNDDIARQGLRFRVNLRPVKYLSIGGSVSRRFQSDLQNKSDNLNGYASYSRIPGIGGRIRGSYNLNISNYLRSTAASVVYSRSFLDRSLQADVYYRFGQYRFGDDGTPRDQHYIGTNLSYNFSRRLTAALSGERATFNDEVNYRIHVRLIARLSSN